MLKVEKEGWYWKDKNTLTTDLIECYDIVYDEACEEWHLKDEDGSIAAEYGSLDLIFCGATQEDRDYLYAKRPVGEQVKEAKWTGECECPLDALMNFGCQCGGK